MNEVREAEKFAIIIDEASDASGKEQLSFCVRIYPDRDEHPSRQKQNACVCACAGQPERHGSMSRPGQAGPCEVHRHGRKALTKI